MNILLRLRGAIALAAATQSMILLTVTAVPAYAVVSSQQAAQGAILTGSLLEQASTSETYQPPDNGGPTTSQGSGTR
jgi:hypothetical protein